MKLQRRWLVFTVAIGTSLAALVLHDIAFPKTTIWQDRQSQRVVSRENQILLPRQERVLYAGIGYEEKTAIWQRGASIAYEQPLEISSVAAIEDAKGHRYLLRLSDLDADRRTATFDIVDPTARIKHRAELTEDMPIPFGSNVKVPWSFHTNSEVFLYADKYLEKPSNELYRVAFLRTTDLTIDLSSLPAQLFRSVPSVGGAGGVSP